MKKPKTLTVILLTVVGTLFMFNFYETRNVASHVEEQFEMQKSTMTAMQNEFTKGNFSEIGKVPQMQEDLDIVKQTMQEQMEVFRKSMEKADEARSRQAFARANLAVIKGEVAVVRQQLLKLKTEQASWDARHASLMTGDQGKRIVGSKVHLELIRGILAQERPSKSELGKWQVAMDELAPLFEGSKKDPDAEIVVYPAHHEKIKEAATWLSEGLARLEEQNSLLGAILKETASFPPAATSLQDLLKAEDDEAYRQYSLTLKDALRAVDAKAKTDRAALLERLHAEAEEAKTQKEAELETAEKEKQDRERMINEEKHAQEVAIAKEAAEKEAEIRAAEADAKRVLSDQQIADIKAAADKAILELEFKRDMHLIERYLPAFTTEGHTHRKDGTKGPVSLGYLISGGALNSDKKGIVRLSSIVHEDNDRPRGALPLIYDFEPNWTNADKKPIETAQELLRKYGDLLVEKKMLAQ